MAPTSSIPRRSMALWLDAPVDWLRQHFHDLRPALMLAVGLSAVPVLGGQVITTSMNNPSSLTSLPITILVGVATVGLILVAQWLLKLVVYASLTLVETGRAVTTRSVLQSACKRPMLTTALAGALLQGSMVVLSVMTCGTGTVFWLILVLYIPLALPVAAREGVGGVSAYLRSMSLVSWTPPRGPWYGATDRVVVALHVIAGISLALSVMPQLPVALFFLDRFRDLAGGGPPDLQSLPELLRPPIWLSLPAQLSTAAFAVVSRFYSARLFLDLHTDLVDAREGASVARALNALQATTTGAAAPTRAHPTEPAL